MFAKLFILVLSWASVWSAEICCSYGGCFNDDFPFSHFALPACPSDIDPLFLLFTRANRDLGANLTMTDIPDVFSGSRMTIFLVHGLGGDENIEWANVMKDELLDEADQNVVIVGWGGGASPYPVAATNTRSVAAELAIVMDNLKNNGGSDPSRLYCIGHSLGAHLCGFTGTRTSLGRITGLDPAGGLFDEPYPIEACLNPESASFVDVLHTCGSNDGGNTLGTMRIMGDMDFYPNGGGPQTGCSTPICSHNRAFEFYTESVMNDCFIARSRCTNHTDIPGSCSDCGEPCGIMGYGASGSGIDGLYYLTTDEAPPFCQN